MAAEGLHISISAETVFEVGGLAVTNSMISSTIVSAILILFAFMVRGRITNTHKPKGLQNLAEWIVEALYNLTYNVTGNHKKARLFFPLISTFFLFVILNNWAGLIPLYGPVTTKPSHSEGADHIEEMVAPEEGEAHSLEVVDTAYAVDAVDTHDDAAGEHSTDDTHSENEEHASDEAHETEGEEAHGEEGAHSAPAATPILRAATADLNMTLALALISVSVTQVFGVMHLKFSYFKKFINFKNPLMFFVGILELISEVAKVVSFAFRLFGNVFAGEVLLVVITFLAPIALPMPFYGLEVFVGFIQALVFAMLSLVFFDMATHSHDEH